MRRFSVLESLMLTMALILGAAIPLLAQTNELVILAENVRFGTDEVKRNALQALGRFKSEEASRAALPGLSDPSEVIVATAIGAIISLPKAEGAEYISPFLNASSEFIRKEAAFALGNIGNQASAFPLSELLAGDRKEEVRAAAAVALGKIGNPVAIASLTNVLLERPKESNTFLRRSAARALGQIAERLHKRPVSRTTPDSFLPNDLKKSLEHPGKESVDIDFERATEVLGNVVQSQKEHNDTKREAAFALGAIGDEQSTEILRRLASSNDYYLAEICREALIRIERNE